MSTNCPNCGRPQLKVYLDETTDQKITYCTVCTWSNA